MTSTRVGYAPPIWTRAQFSMLKESRLRIRKDKDETIVAHISEVWTRPVMQSQCHLCKSAMLLEKSVTGHRKTNHNDLAKTNQCSCFGKLSWNFVYDFHWMNIRSSFSVINFCRSCAPFGTYYSGNTQFATLFLYVLWHEILYMTFI